MSAVATAGAAPAFAEAPEFGRCLAQAGGHFEDAGCTKPAAAGTEKFEWTPVLVKNHFTTRIKEATTFTFETAGGSKYTCTGEEGGGEIAGPKLVKNVTMHFKGCKSSGAPCQNAGVEEIVTNSLDGALGIETVGTTPPLNNKLATELKAEGGGNFAEFSCFGLPVIWKGSILHPFTANKMIGMTTEEYAATAGEQKPSAFAGESTDSHTGEMNINGGPFEEMGWTMKDIGTFEEKIEASTVN